MDSNWRIKYRNYEKLIGVNKMSYLFVFISGLFYFSSTLFIKVVQNEIDFAQANHLRGLFCVLVSYWIIKKEGESLEIKRDIFKFLLIRITIVTLEQLYIYFAVQHVPLSTVYIINSSSPIIIFIMNFLIYGKKISLPDVLGSICCFLGIIMVLDPNLFYFQEQSEQIQQQKYIYFEGKAKFLTLLGVFLIKILWSFGVVVMQKFQGKNSPIIITFYQTLAYSFGGGLAQNIFPSNLITPFLTKIATFFILGTLTFAFQFSFLSALLLTQNHGRTTSIGQLQTIYSFIVEIFILKEIPLFLQVFGAALVLGGIFYILLRSRKE